MCLPDEHLDSKAAMALVNTEVWRPVLLSDIHQP